ncbi:MAG TPA: tetratricopeptide repeat protein [Terracidiphilus sp.]|nr:tetratricopeptide repeat protein [Terracidiphilus sp.]
MTEASKRFHFPSLEFRREPLTLFLLTGLAIILVAIVALFSRLYHAKLESLAEEWSSRGSADLDAHHYADAVVDYRTALLYDRDNDSYQLNLAEALIGHNGKDETDEAATYLINLWDRQPENGTVNLELARIAASKGQTDRAIRFYNNAIYAIWPGDQEQARHTVRLELIALLMRIHSTVQAQSELIALADNLGEDPPAQAHAAGLFYQTGDYEQALNEYRVSLRGEPHNADALAGAGQAAFKLNQFRLAHRYLRDAVFLRPTDKDSAQLLKLSNLVLQMDPFRQQIRAVDRERIVISDFAAAGNRLKSCTVTGVNSATATRQQSLQQSWNKLKPQVTGRGLRRNPDLINTAMSLVFQVERAGNDACGPGSDTDKALSLIANLHEGL